MDQPDDGVPIAELLDERQHLLDVVTWMLGSSSEAESVTDEAYRRWYALSDQVRAQITAPRAWLANVAGGICLARLALSGAGETPAGDQEADETLAEEISEVLLYAVDSLSPAERAAFVLNDVFGVTPDVLPRVVGQPVTEHTEPADRALSSLRAGRTRPTTSQQHDAVVHAVREACVREDAVFLTSLMAPDATAFFDGGGKIRALVKPVHGSKRVARSLLTLLARRPRTTLHAQSVNGLTGLVVRYNHQVAAVISLDIAGRHVVQVWAVLNPDKLRSWNQAGPRTYP
ncbi:RNA polymerase subunit sigma [Streptomyces sp. NPDC006678]|uniref:RNA polymerase subunit sigma n=1 Tax=Streptomyces sp. NPDC006678 TaxID=3157185 RepID=UPI0033CD4195